MRNLKSNRTADQQKKRNQKIVERLKFIGRASIKITKTAALGYISYKIYKSGTLKHITVFTFEDNNNTKLLKVKNLLINSLNNTNPIFNKVNEIPLDNIEDIEVLGDSISLVNRIFTKILNKRGIIIRGLKKLFIRVVIANTVLTLGNLMLSNVIAYVADEIFMEIFSQDIYAIIDKIIKVYSDFMEDSDSMFNSTVKKIAIGSY